MGIDYDAKFLYGVKFTFKEIEHLKTNPVVVEEPGDDFGFSLSEFWYGEFEGVHLSTGSPYFDSSKEDRGFYVSSPKQKDFECMDKADFMEVLNDDEFIKSLKRFCDKFGLDFTRTGTNADIPSGASKQPTFWAAVIAGGAISYYFVRNYFQTSTAEHSKEEIKKKAN
ncbi:hypothetical protein MP638_001767 [Amoeboaphelidium occidentale]|nr:hypothetical protein MP638_001767 [Amoeboaphelidium occidentale]